MLQPAQRLGLDPRLVRPRRQHDQRRQPVEPLGEVADEAQRGDVGPVGVVDREHQRPALGQRRRPARRARRARPRSASGRVRSGSAMPKIAAASATGPAKSRARAAGSSERSKGPKSWRTTPKPKSRSISEPVARRTRRPRRRGARAQLAEQRRLADPRRPLDQQRLPARPHSGSPRSPSRSLPVGALARAERSFHGRVRSADLSADRSEQIASPFSSKAADHAGAAGNQMTLPARRPALNSDGRGLRAVRLRSGGLGVGDVFRHHPHLVDVAPGRAATAEPGIAVGVGDEPADRLDRGPRGDECAVGVEPGRS